MTTPSPRDLGKAEAAHAGSEGLSRGRAGKSGGASPQFSLWQVGGGQGLTKTTQAKSPHSWLPSNHTYNMLLLCNLPWLLPPPGKTLTLPHHPGHWY